MEENVVNVANEVVEDQVNDVQIDKSEFKSGFAVGTAITTALLIGGYYLVKAAKWGYKKVKEKIAEKEERDRIVRTETGYECEDNSQDE